MTKLLHIDFSPRGVTSHSRTLSAEFISAWQTAHPNDAVVYRDIGHEPVPNVSEDWIAAVYAPAESHTPAQAQAIAPSNTLVRELLDADVYVFGVPMYNFGVPGGFKAYVDQIVVPGRTVVFSQEGQPRGVLQGKKLFVLTSRGLGNYEVGEPWAEMNFQEPYIRAIFRFIGVTEVTFVNANWTQGTGQPQASLEKVKPHIERAVANANAQPV